MPPHPKGARTVLLAVGLACCDEAAPPLEAIQPQVVAQSPPIVDPAARYFRSFDPLTLTGIQELDRSAIDYPYVAITRSDDGSFMTVRGEMKDSSADSHCRFSMVYERRGDVFVKRELHGPLEKGYDYTEEACHVHAGEEFCYFYLRKHDSTPPKGPRNALLAYTRESRREKVELWFTIWFAEEKIVRDTIEFNPADPLPQQVRQKADIMRVFHYSRDKAGEIETVTKTEHWFDDGVPIGVDTYGPVVQERSESIPQFYLLLDDLRGCSTKGRARP